MSDSSSLSRDENGIGAGATRRRRFVYAIAASGVSKLLAFAVQLLALPLALHSLGTDRYTSFLALQSFLSWTGLFGFGLSYALPKYISAAFVAGDRAEERHLVGSSLILISAASGVLMAVLLLLGLVVSPATLVAAASSISYDELRTAYFVAVVVNTVQLIASVDPTIRSGYQEFHWSSVASLAAWALVLVGLLLASQHPVTISTFIVVIYAPIALTFLVDIALLFRQRPHLRRGGVDFRATVAKIAMPSGNAIAYQIQFGLVMYLPVLIMAHLTNPSQTAIFGSVLQLVVLGVSSLNLVLQPLTSAMANAHSHNDVGWIRRSHAKMLWFIIPVGAAGVVLAAAVGPFLIRHWLGAAMQVSRELLAGFGVCLVLMALVQLEFFSLSAMGALRSAGFAALVAGLAGVVLGAVLCVGSGAMGMVIGMAAGLAASAAALFVSVRREMSRMESGPVAPV